MSDSFNWRDDPEIVLTEQLAIAVYRGARDHVVIRQEASSDEDEDHCIFVLPQNAMRVARAILAAAGLEWPAPSLDNIQERPEAKTPGAIRQARFRKSKRNAVTPVTPVTRDSVTELFAFDALAPLHERESTSGGRR